MKSVRFILKTLCIVIAIPWVVFLLGGPLWIAVEIIEYCFPIWSIGKEYELRLLGSFLALPIWYILFKYSGKVAERLEKWFKKDSQHPDNKLIIDKIEARLKFIELTPRTPAAEKAKRELREICFEFNIKPPPEIQQLLIPATSQPRSVDTQQ